jgi:hypothetical protein
MAAPTNAASVKKALANPEPSTHVQVFGRRNAETFPALGQPASEKRQGTKSRREVVRRQCRKLAAVPQTLWGFGGAVEPDHARA